MTVSSPGQAQFVRGTETLCGVMVASPEILVTELMRGQAAESLRETPWLLTLSQPEHHRVWIITKPSHAAHPAVACRRVTTTGELISVSSERFCRGPSAACAQFRADIQMQDEAIRRRGNPL